MVGSCVGPYKIVRQIAEDRFGNLFQAIDPERKKQVAIKLLRPEAADRPEVASRLYSEAATLALLNHPHIARIFGFMRLHDRLYLVMEFVEGQSLAAILKEKHRLEPKVALGFFHQILPAVQYAHDLGVVHGDLKPSNIMVSSFAQIRILGFAISAILGNLGLEGRPNTYRTEYMSPEQIKGESIDIRSDVYSLGMLLYRLIVGKPPFQSEPKAGISRERGSSAPFPPSLLVPNCPAWLDGFMQRALAADPAERFQSISAMSSAMGFSLEPRAPGLTPKRARCRIKDDMTSTLHDPAKARARRIAQSWTVGLRAWKKGLPRLTDGGWKRSVVVAIGLASIMIEPFIFRGTNIVPSLDYKPLPARRMGIAQIPMEPVPRPLVTGAQDDNIGALQPSNDDRKPQPQRRVVKRDRRDPRPLEKPGEKPAGKADDQHLEALDSKRTVTYRAEPDKSRPVLKELKPIEPSPPRSNEGNNPAKPQLNVIWEN